MKRTPPSAATREKNRLRERARYAKLRLDPEYRKKENARLAKYVERRRANPSKLDHDRAVNAKRMQINREYDEFFTLLKETQGA